MGRESLKDIHGVKKLGIRMNYYPSCAKPDLVLGVSPHSDASSLTLLLQDDEITGHPDTGCYKSHKRVTLTKEQNLAPYHEQHAPASTRTHKPAITHQGRHGYNAEAHKKAPPTHQPTNMLLSTTGIEPSSP